MSLINQMLKDLEARRANALEQPDGALDGLAWSGYREPEGRNRRRALAAGIALGAAVAGAAGAALWHWPGGSSAAPAATQSAAVSAAPPPADAPASAPAPAPGLETRPPATAPDGSPARAVAAAPPSPPAPAAAPPRGSAPAPVPAPVPRQAAPAPALSETPAAPRRAEPAAPADPPAMRKTPRPPSPEQQAALAYQRGYEALRRGDTGAAEQALGEALQRLPAHREARDALVGLLLQGGRLVEARAVLEEGVALQPGDPRLSALYARVLAEQGETERAVQALQRRPPPLSAEPEYHALLAALEQRLGRHSEAARLYGQLVELHPAVGPWWAGLGISLEAQGEGQAAREAFRRALNGGGLAPALRDYVRQRLARLENRLG